MPSYLDQEQNNEVSGNFLNQQTWDSTILDGDGNLDLFTAFDDISNFSSYPTFNPDSTKQLDVQQRPTGSIKNEADGEEQSMSISNTVSSTSKTVFKCRRCPPELERLFSSKAELRLHSAVHNRVRASSSQKQPKIKKKNVKYHYCDMPNCDYFSDRSASVKRHLISHTNEKPYTCSFCGMKYKSDSGFRRHVNKFHKDQLSQPDSGSSKENSLPEEPITEQADLVRLFENKAETEGNLIFEELSLPFGQGESILMSIEDAFLSI